MKKDKNQPLKFDAQFYEQIEKKIQQKQANLDKIKEVFKNKKLREIPTYWIVKYDENSEHSQLFSDWFDMIFDINIFKMNQMYYGYDGNKQFKNGLSYSKKAEYFSNNPTVLNLNEWYEVFCK